MRRLGFLVSLLLVLMSVAHGSAIYIAQNAAGANSGADCADAHSAAWFNANAVGGNTYHLCGTFTGGANASAILTVPNSGTASSPLIVLAEPNALFTAAYWNAGQYLGNVGGAIIVNGKNYVILDGGTNGTIQNTANGQGLTYSANSAGMYVYGSNIIVRNWTIQNIYVPTNALGTTWSADLTVSGTNITVCNNTLNSAYAGLVLLSTGASVQVNDCQSNTFGIGTNVFLNSFQQNAWSINNSPSSASSPNIYANDIQLAGAYGTRVQGCGGSDAHTDGVFSYSTGRAIVITPYIYNNSFSGSLGNGCPTAPIACTYGGGYTNAGATCTVFNNVMTTNLSGSIIAPAFWLGGNTGYVVGPHKIYNNTLVNIPEGFTASNNVGRANNNTIHNNIVTTNSNNTGAIYYGFNGIEPFKALDVNANVYYAPNATNPWYWANTFKSTLAAWKTACTRGGGSNCDATSVYGAPQLDTNNRLTSTSNGRAANGFQGDNLTSLCTGQMAPLCYDKPPVVGKGGSLTGNVQRPSVGAWDAGAYQYSTQTGGGTGAPTGLNVTVN